MSSLLHLALSADEGISSTAIQLLMKVSYELIYSSGQSKVCDRCTVRSVQKIRKLHVCRLNRL